MDSLRLSKTWLAEPRTQAPWRPSTARPLPQPSPPRPGHHRACTELPASVAIFSRRAPCVLFHEPFATLGACQDDARQIFSPAGARANFMDRSRSDAEGRSEHEISLCRLTDFDHVRHGELAALPGPCYFSHVELPLSFDFAPVPAFLASRFGRRFRFKPLPSVPDHLHEGRWRGYTRPCPK